MWWLLVPVALGAGKIIYDAVTDDDDSTSSSYSDREEREAEAKRRAGDEKKERILEDIDNFINTQKVKMENKYPDATILFDQSERLQILMAQLGGETEYVDIEKASKVTVLFQDNNIQEEINALQEEMSNIQDALKELEEIKNEAFK